jgi:DNA adenine methylase
MSKSYPAVIKWSGSKRLVALQLAKYFPHCKTYYEPFVGGGAMLPFADADHGIAGDIIPELIELWNAIKISPSHVASEYKKRWKKLQDDGQEVYYQIRDRFNKTKNCYDFLFLTRTCVNGLIRYNQEGHFNNSFHLSRPGICPETLKKQIFLWSKTIQKIDFRNVDYRECLQNARQGDFVFLDPPYGGTKDRYKKIEFNLNDFYSELERLNKIGVKWMMTFDGIAGNRTYTFAPPDDLYERQFSITTGNSAFIKLMEHKQDVIRESVYLNFNAVCLPTDLFYNSEETLCIGA